MIALADAQKTVSDAELVELIEAQRTAREPAAGARRGRPPAPRTAAATRKSGTDTASNPFPLSGSRYP